MKREEFVEKLAIANNVTSKVADSFLKSITNTITEVISNGDSIRLYRFGNFMTSKRAAHKGQNPQTGRKIDIPACTVPKLKMSKSLKVAVNTVPLKVV